MRALADTIDSNLRALEEIAITLLTHNDSLAIEAHRVWVDLKEGIADLRGETVNDGCNCDECECENQDDYTQENGTCEECFRDCQVTECDCSEVCGWHKPHTVAEGETVCSNCGTPTQYGEENSIEFECQTHGDVSWSR